MTIVKSFKYKQNVDGKETIRKHRTHTAKKNRRSYPVSLNCKVFKDKRRRLEEEELSEEILKCQM